MKKKYTWIRQITRVLMTLMLTIAVSVPVMAEPKAVDVDTQLSNMYTVTVASGYLALRTEKAYRDANEIGQLYTGESVELVDASDSTYWYVYSSKHDKYGYVNRKYLANSSYECTVIVRIGYLALRNAKAYKSSNEIAKLYSGDIVQIADTSDDTYWLVYAPDFDKGGYVNKDYLVDRNPVIRKTVKVTSGYLALRSEMAYDDANEIGRLNTGDIVQIADSSDSTYWKVYSERLGKYGYVNKDYLVSSSTVYACESRAVKVDKGYLALRNAKTNISLLFCCQIYTDICKVTLCMIAACTASDIFTADYSVTITNNHQRCLRI